MVVAAANVQLHRDRLTMEVPIFAAAKSSRRQGYGSVLTGLLVGLGRRLGMRTLVVSATDESRAFWVKQGLHTGSFCAPAERTAMRALNALGLVRAFSNSILMAMPIAPAGAAGLEEGGAARVERCLCLNGKLHGKRRDATAFFCFQARQCIAR